MVARRVCWRGSASRSPWSRSSRCDSRSSSCSAEKTAVRAAASSIASGSSSRRAQSSSTDGVVVKVGSTARARARKSSAPSCSERGGTGQVCSPPMRRRSRLVTSRHEPFVARSAATRSAAGGSRCSTLSRSTSSDFPERWATSVSSSGVPGSSLTASARASEGSRSSGSRSGASGTQKMPSGKDSDASAAACRASRVLPVPPGPVKVRSRVRLVRSSTTSDSSRSRPRKGVAGTGRFVRYRVLSGGKSSLPSW